MPAKPASDPASPAPVFAIRTEASPVPARQLGKDGKALWDKLHRDFDISDAHEVEMALQLCQAADLAERITDDPRAQLAARSFVVRTLKNLFGQPKRDKPGRPPGRGNPW